MDRTNADDAEFDRVFFPADHALHVDDERAAISTGSMVACGDAPWPPRPWNVMARLSELDDPTPTR